MVLLVFYKLTKFIISGITINMPNDIVNIQNFIFPAMPMKLFIDKNPTIEVIKIASNISVNCILFIPSIINRYKFAIITAGMLIINDNLSAVWGSYLFNNKYEVVIPDLEIPGITANP